MERYDVIVVGAGPGGLAAAAAARESGAEKVLVLERDSRPGGILNQCIHDGFGLVYYGEALTGPEYARRAVREAQEAGAEIKCGTMVTDIGRDGQLTAVSRDGLHTFAAGALVLATGCRERTRGAISIPGARPAGVFTAGVVQNLINVQNIMPGRRAVILGSGDIGLIMARRLKLEGAQVEAVLEMLPEPSGLKRNVSQCLYDFSIPLYTGCTVIEILGKKRVEGVKAAEVGPDGQVIEGTERVIPCDMLILSVGLIPENELAKSMGIRPNLRDNSLPTDEYMQTEAPGVFSCGNSRKVTDLADYATRQGRIAGKNAAAYAGKEKLASVYREDANPMPKGFPAEGCVICTRCPKGCQVSTAEGGAEGNICERGAEFARQERVNPMRILTTTMMTRAGRLVSVRSDGMVPKHKMGDYARKLGGMVLPDKEIVCGCRLISDFDGSGVDITSTGSLE